MDENSCEDETSKSVEKVVDGQKPKEMDDSFELEDMKIKTEFIDQKKTNQVSDRCGSSYDAAVSGTSSNFFPVISENKADSTHVQSANAQEPRTNKEDVEEPETSLEINEEDVEDENPSLPCLIPVYEAPPSSPPRVRMASTVEEQLSSRKGSIGPPPSYSFVMKQKRRLKLPSPESLITSRPPPPAYGGNRGLYVDDETRLERMCNLPSFGEPIWRSHSQPAFCNRCGVIVLTTTHSHDSIATHVAALALCLFGCWPCCLLPYCMSVCKNTYHHCPICQAFLGVYSPW